MATAGRAYVVRDADAASKPGEVTRVYPYTLQGLTTALDDARFHSYGGTPQVVAILEDGKSRVIRRFEDGHGVLLALGEGVLARARRPHLPAPSARHREDAKAPFASTGTAGLTFSWAA
jgi:hypothetical protein